ncbi:single-stranded DNA-binding protein [Anaerospora hongkongensis]|uniref:single-stranded DNA-binding protein n=1 Tax=Anaerospora hongkongensis TaxID=244830 RepID=UPI002FD945B3
MNRIKVLGRLAQFPEATFTKNGKAVTTFTVASSRPHPSQEGKEITDFIPVVVWGNLAEKCGNGLGRGDRVLVEGRLQVRSYEGSDGQKKRVSEVVADFVAKELWSGDDNTGGGTQESPFDRMGHEVPGDY